MKNNKQNVGISDDRLKHIMTVARNCYLIAKDKGMNEDECREAFITGFLHDVGYEFSQKPSLHPITAANLLKNINSEKVITAIENHGDPNAVQTSLLSVLNEADLKTDSKGNTVTVEERLDDIRSRYDINDDAYKNPKKVAELLKLI